MKPIEPLPPLEHVPVTGWYLVTTRSAAGLATHVEHLTAGMPLKLATQPRNATLISVTQLATGPTIEVHR